MSLGIYDAFIFDQSYTMEELTKMIDILRKDVKKPIDVQLHKYVLEKFLYCYYLRGNLSTDEILEMAKEETDYDKKMWLQDTAQGQWKSLYRNIVLYIRGKVRNQTRDNLLESLDYNYRAVLFLFAVEDVLLLCNGDISKCFSPMINLSFLFCYCVTETYLNAQIVLHGA